MKVFLKLLFGWHLKGWRLPLWWLLSTGWYWLGVKAGLTLAEDMWGDSHNDLPMFILSCLTYWGVSSIMFMLFVGGINYMFWQDHKLFFFQTTVTSLLMAVFSIIGAVRLMNPKPEVPVYAEPWGYRGPE